MASSTVPTESSAKSVTEPIKEEGKNPVLDGGVKRSQADKEEDEEEGEGNDDTEAGSASQSNLQQSQRTRKNRRRGKGKTKKLPPPPEFSSTTIDPGKQQIALKVAEEQVQQIVTKGFLAACWSLGIVLPQHATPRNSPTRFTFDTHVGSVGNHIYPAPVAPVRYSGEYNVDHDHLLFGRTGPSGVNWEGTLMSIVDRAAHDPVTMESLVQDLALALPEISLEIQHHHQDEDYYDNGWEFGTHGYSGAAHDSHYYSGTQQIPPPPGFSLDPDMHASTSYIDLLLQSPHMSKHSSGTSGTQQQQPKHRSHRAKMWGSSSSLASLSLAVASAAVEDEADRVLTQSDDESDEEPPLYKAWDPDRAARVALVTELAEKERHRRIAEREELTWKDRVNRAARIEWAVLASEAERQRRALADAAKMEREQRLQRLKQQVLDEENERRRRASSAATTATAAMSTLDESGMSLLNVSGLSIGSNASAATASPAASSVPVSPPMLPTPTAQPQSSQTQPLYIQDYEVICPYSVLGCDATLRRSELPQHFLTCPFRAEVIEAKRLALLKETYNPLDHVVVCPYTVVGCTYSCRRADLPAHLQVCQWKMERNLSLQSMVYEVVCPYTPLGCTVTCLRSQIGFHLQECPFRPRSRQEEDQERESNRQYAIQVEEQERSRRVASPRERLTSMDSKTRGLVLEAIVANPAPRPQPGSRPPQSVSGPKPQVPSQPITAFSAAVQHRHRTMSMDKQQQARDRTGSVSLPPVAPTSGGLPALDLSQAGPTSPIVSPASAPPAAQPAGPKDDDEELARSRRVSWVVQAAEIERMRKAEEKIALLSNQTTPSASSSSSVAAVPKTPPMSPNRKLVLHRFQSGGEESESPPGRKRIVLEAALRRQRLHHARWFPAESLEFQGRRTHVYSFHNHMEQQTRHLHRALHDEIERFGRDCALWELSCQASVNALMEKIRGVVESTWIKFIATTPPTLHMFGSFASELSVPGVSDLDLVVVPGAIPAEQVASPSATTTARHQQQSPPTSGPPPSLQRSNSLTQHQAQQQATAVPISRSASMPPQPPTTTSTTRRASLSSIPPLPPSHSPMVMHTRKTVLGEGMTSPTRSSSTPSPSDHRKLPSPSLGPQPSSKSRRSASIDSNASTSFTGASSSSSSSQTNFARLRSRSIPDANSSETHMRNLMRDRLEAARRCRILGESLMQCDFLQNVKVIDTASVPVINMRTSDVSPRLDIDLTVALTNHDGLAAAEFVKMLRTRFPPLMPMVRLLKAFLHSRGLANPFHGGLPSYALVLMATCSVIRSCDRVGPRQACFLSQGELVVDFLDLFGREFDPRTEAVCCNWKADLDKLGIGRAVTTELPLLYISSRVNSLSGSLPHQQEVTLVVDDPIRFGNNVGRSSFAFAQVQQAFAEVLASLLSHVVKNEALGRSSASASATSNSSLLERVFGVQPFSQPGQDATGATKKT